MSIPVQDFSAALAQFQSQFGGPPGGPDPKAECEKWQRLCAELLAERDRLQTELAKERAAHERTVLTMMRDEVDPSLTREQIYAGIDRETSLDDILERLRQEVERGE